MQTLRRLLILVSCCALFAQADDTEIYVSQVTTAAPNVVFVMDTSGSMGSTVKDSSGKSVGTRLEVVREAAVDVINNTTNLNIALMRFNRTNSQGGWLSTPMMSIDNETSRSIIKDVLYSYTANGATPITESLFEAGSFLRGDPIKYGKTTTENSDLCLTWKSEQVPVDVPSAGSEHAWWWEVVKNDWWLIAKTFNSKTMTWKAWSSLSKSQKSTLEIKFDIVESNYGVGDVPWWFALSTSLRNAVRDHETGTFSDWNDLTKSQKNSMTKTYSIDQTRYDYLVANDKTGEGTGPVEVTYETVYTCVEYLNLDSAHDGNGNYISPIVEECQTNHIVMFTDGDPNSDTDINSTVQTMVQGLSSVGYPTAKDFSTRCSGEGGCAEELSWYYYHADNSSTLAGTQPIYIHTIGGFISGAAQTRLDAMATYGGGVSANGFDPETLRDALTKIFENISSTTGTFSAPAVAVNAFNSLEHLDQLYYSVFRPAVNSRWYGNIKRYRIDSNGIVRDSEGKIAVDDTTGFFSDNANSYWTLEEDNPDGSAVRKGGIARRLTAPANRHITTWLGGSKRLMDVRNRISSTNTALQDATLFDTDLTGTDFTNMLQWAAGYNDQDSTGARREVEDPLHSRPVLVTYGYTTDANGNKVPDAVMYVGTNSGYLHGFNTNAESPFEHFAFVPKELLPNLAAYYSGTYSKVYGLDGQITVWHQDTNNNNIVDNEEKAYLYAGMRRGGSSYYALDISDRNNPYYLWQIDAGSTGFEELGQTWSGIKLVDMLWNGTPTTLLAFAGGYDPAEDDTYVRTTHSQGNAVYLADPATGKLVWKASPHSDANLRLNDMTSAIPSSLTPVDMDDDGYVDLFYATDLGGRVWRIDFINQNGKTSSQGGIIADFGKDNSQTDNVRFYTSPDVSWSNEGYFYNSSSKSLYSQERFQIAVGSGYRAHPLNNLASDRLYIINDFNTSSAPASYTRLGRSDLADYSSYNSASVSQVKNGLFYSLPDLGEKSLSDSITANGYTYFTTYRPSNGQSRSGCEPDIGYGRLYIIKPQYYNLADDGSIKLNKPTVDKPEITQPGIPTVPVLIYPPGEEGGKHGPKVIVGAEVFESAGGDQWLRRNYWREYD